MPLGLAQRSAKCRICGEHFFKKGDVIHKSWAYCHKAMLYPQHVILNYGEECAHAKCLEPIKAKKK